jgi:hypothetical protein
MAALPALRKEWAIFPPSSFEAARVWKVFTLLGRTGEEREDPYSTAILQVSLYHNQQSTALRLSVGQALSPLFR